jgi:signal transduction histidine kinase/CheY-like chemotaxis protein
MSIHTDALLDGQREALELIVQGRPLPAVLGALCRVVEEQAGGTVLSAIMLVDEAGTCLRIGAAPSLPDEYTRALDGVAIQPGVGTCIAAAARREPVVTADIAAAPEWEPYRHLPLGLGLRAAWSMPIVSAGGRVLGTFGTYFFEPREPTPHERRLVAVLARTAALAIERRRFDDALRASEARHRFLADLAAATQPLLAADEVLTVTARRLAEHLGADRCAYAEVEAERVFVITGDYARGVASIVGRWDVAAFGPECVRQMLANEPYVVHDTDTDPRIGPEDLPAYRATEIRAVICVPLHKNRSFTAAMAVHQKTPRQWTADEVELVHTVVARCWEALERDRVARSLGESRARLEYAVRLSGVGFWYCDLPFDELMWDDRVKEHFWLSPGARVTIDTFYDRLHPDDRAPTRAAIETSIANHTPYDVDYRTVDPATGAVRWVRALGGTAYGLDGTPVRFDGVTLDVTAKKRDEERLAGLYDELRNQEQRKDEFLATLAHELRNPLAPIRSGLEVLRIAGDGERGRKTREMMERQVGHMVRMVDDLLDVSRITRGNVALRPERVELRAVLDSAVEASRPLIERAGHVLEARLPRDPLPLDADPTRLAQVLSNLLNNAAKYTPRGGRILVTAERDSGDLVVRVADTGVGIPSDMLPKVFDMFTQVGQSIDGAQGGLGIGLTLVRRLVELHGGTVAADSPGPGQGSTFTVRLPAAARAEAAPATPSAAPSVVSPPLRILVVDDNVDGAEALALLLGLRGHEVQVEHTGPGAVAAARAFRPELVFLDIGLPGMTGYEVARRLRAEPALQGMRIVALTGWGAEEDRRRAREAGFDDHLVKPVDPARVEAVLAG